MQPARVLPQSPFNTQHDRVLDFVKNGPNILTYLHQHQITAVLAAKRQLENPNQPNIALVVLPTGCGKTGVAVLCPYVLNSPRVLVITPSEKVSKQIHQAFCGKPPPNPVQSFLTVRGVLVNEDAERLVLPIGAFIDRSEKILGAHVQNHVVVVNAHKVGGQSKIQIDRIPRDGYDLVIVDEAHHYPAPTWKLLVDHFQNSKRLFLTATPEWRGKSILDYLGLHQIHQCYRLSLKDAIEGGIIRRVQFDEILDDEADRENDMAVYKATAVHIEDKLNQHDQDDPSVRHQAMVLTQSREAGGTNAAEDFVAAYTRKYPNSTCEAYITATSQNVLTRFESGEIRTLVIIGRLLEGFDHKKVSVVGIVRNVALSSRVLFAQFVGRAVRKIDRQDPVNAVVVAHCRFNQRANYDQYDRVIAEDDPVDEEN